MSTADGLRLAATYCASYIRGDDDRARMQRVLLRFAAVADCPECDTAGYLREGPARTDHHPMRELCEALGVPDTVDCSMVVDFPEQPDTDEYDGDLFSEPA